MLSYENSFNVDLTETKLPVKDLVLAHVSLVEKDYNRFVEFLSSLLPAAVIINVKKMVLTPEEQVAREFEWIDIDIYVPKTEVNRWFNGMGMIPELISQAVAGTNPLVALVEVINLTDDVTPIYYRREFGDMSIVPLPSDYKYTFTGVSTIVRTDTTGIPIIRAYSGSEFFCNVIANSNLSLDDAQCRPSQSILFALALSHKGFWVFGLSILEAAKLANSSIVNSPSPTLNIIVDNLWKLNPSLKEEAEYQVYHRALHAYKIAFGTLTPEVIASILTNPGVYRGLAEFLITAPNPPAPNLRTYIAEHIVLDAGRYGVTDKKMTQDAPGGL